MHWLYPAVNRSALSFADGKADKVNMVERLTEWLLHPTSEGKAAKATSKAKKAPVAKSGRPADTKAKVFVRRLCVFAVSPARVSHCCCCCCL
jgi:hypothetical protein